MLGGIYNWIRLFYLSKMGCCNSKTTSQTDLIDRQNARAAVKSMKNTKKEDKIELAFKIKRNNVFTESVDLERLGYVAKNIPKTPKQKKIICKYYFDIDSVKNYYSQAN